MTPIRISKTTHRRFVMGLQGLWPGRRFAGKDGLPDALHQMEALQLDPLNPAGRSQDIALHGRVLDYHPEHLYQVAYDERHFFDYGAALFIYPMAELPYWLTHMKRRGEQPRWRDFADEHPRAMEQVRKALRTDGPKGNRDFIGNQKFKDNYRGKKDTSVALYTLWITGEVMTHHREGFTRVYDLTERVAPAEFQYAAPEREAEDFFAHKTVSFRGVLREKRWRVSFKYYIQRDVDKDEESQWLGNLYEKGLIAPVQVEGSKDRWITLAEHLPLLEKLETGKVPSAWKPLGLSTQDEVTFVAPLEIVSARGRAKEVFDFEYVWEVYKPLAQRRWGYYVLPILYGDQLLARLDPKLDRITMILHINGFWLEKNAVVKEPAFADALGKGLVRFAHFVGANQVDVDVVNPNKLKTHVQGILKKAL